MSSKIIRKEIANMPLKKKILAVVLLGILITVLTSILIIKTSLSGDGRFFVLLIGGNYRLLKEDGELIHDAFV